MHTGKQLVDNFHRSAQADFCTDVVHFSGDALSTGCNFSNACADPDAITVISPCAALAAPPETGASNMIKPNSVNF